MTDEDTLKRLVIGASSPITKSAALTLLTAQNPELKKEIEDLVKKNEKRTERSELFILD